MINQESTDVKIKFREAPYYRKLPASGAFGGPTPQGDIVCNFYLEQQILPSSVTMKVVQGRLTHEEFQYEKGEYYERELQVGLVLNPQTAKSIGEWLVKRADEVISRRQKEDFIITRH